MFVTPNEMCLPAEDVSSMQRIEVNIDDASIVGGRDLKDFSPSDQPANPLKAGRRGPK
jgi:hypothetical protein